MCTWFLQGVSQMHLLFFNVIFYIWICDLDDKCEKAHVARELSRDKLWSLKNTGYSS